MAAMNSYHFAVKTLSGDIFPCELTLPADARPTLDAIYCKVWHDLPDHFKDGLNPWDIQLMVQTDEKEEGEEEAEENEKERIIVAVQQSDTLFLLVQTGGLLEVAIQTTMFGHLRDTNHYFYQSLRLCAEYDKNGDSLLEDTNRSYSQTWDIQFLARRTTNGDLALYHRSDIILTSNSMSPHMNNFHSNVPPCRSIYELYSRIKSIQSTKLHTIPPSIIVSVLQKWDHLLQERI
jgi:hypothetical protein